MWARIDNNIVSELTDIAPDGRFHPELIWVACPAGTQPGWAFDGEIFHSPTAPVAKAPKTCTPAQGLVALYALKQITEDHVLEAIAQIPDPVQQYTARIGYQRATTWERSSPTMQAMAQLLQLSEQDLDALYAYAAGVNV